MPKKPKPTVLAGGSITINIYCNASEDKKSARKNKTRSAGIQITAPAEGDSIPTDGYLAQGKWSGSYDDETPQVILVVRYPDSEEDDQTFPATDVNENGSWSFTLNGLTSTDGMSDPETGSDYALLTAYLVTSDGDDSPTYETIAPPDTKSITISDD